MNRNIPTLHYLIVPREEDPRHINSVLTEFDDWMEHNFNEQFYLNRYSLTISVLFKDQDQIFLTRLRWHDIMVPVI